MCETVNGHLTTYFNQYFDYLNIKSYRYDSTHLYIFQALKSKQNITHNINIFTIYVQLLCKLCAEMKDKQTKAHTCACNNTMAKYIQCIILNGYGILCTITQTRIRHTIIIIHAYTNVIINDNSLLIEYCYLQ